MKNLKLRKIRVMGLVLLFVGIVMLLTTQSWAVTGSLSDSGLYILAGWGTSIAIIIIAIVMIVIG